VTDYAKRMRDGSTEYRLGRLNRRSVVLRDDWTPEQRAEYEKGLSDRQKLAKRARRRRDFEAVVTPVAGVLIIAVTWLAIALLLVSPVLIILIALKILFF
jgi:hypothetical protein